MWPIFGTLALVCTVLGQIPDAPRVTISQGTVVGSSGENGSYFRFYGIPYADSTSGSHRFKAPSAPPLFQEEFIADRQNVKCVRALGFGYEGTEDCLVVDVMTPTLDNNSRLPVMVWVKGKELDKAYIPELSPRRFMQKEVLVVSLNYRESILGFLCLGTETAPGNAGLKDIVAGLRWVQENIAAFGGDPNNVVLFGHGSGAAAVDLISVVSQAEGLVHKIIAQSGTATAPWAVTRDNLKYAIEVAQALGHTITDIETLSDVFTRTNLAALMAVINELELKDNSLAFAPCIEKSDLENVEPLLTKTPYEIIKGGEQLQIPFMTGYVDFEGTLRAEEAIANNWIEKMDDSFSDFIQPDIHFVTEEQETQVAQDIKRFYFGYPTDITNMTNYLSYQGDTMILISTIREARLRAETSLENIYLYQFSHNGVLGHMFVRPVDIDAAGHNEELAYLFYDDEHYIDVDENEQIVANIILERWTNFAKTGVPSSETSSIEWLPFTINNSEFLRIIDDGERSENDEIIFEIPLNNPFPNRLTFWNNIYENYFVDAFSRWELNTREEEEEDEDDENDVDIDEGSEDDNTDEEDDSDDADNGSPDSASSITAYTFTIVSLFAILDKFHMLQITS